MQPQLHPLPCPALPGSPAAFPRFQGPLPSACSPTLAPAQATRAPPALMMQSSSQLGGWQLGGYSRATSVHLILHTSTTPGSLVALWPRGAPGATRRHHWPTFILPQITPQLPGPRGHTGWIANFSLLGFRQKFLG